MTRRVRGGAALLSLLAAIACDGNDGQAACTQEFRLATVYLRDEAAQAVTDASVRTYLVRTGELVPVNALADLAAGHYVVLDDGATRLIESASEPFRVVVERSGTSPLEALYTFRAPQGCHIEKVSGPDTLVLP